MKPATMRRALCVAALAAACARTPPQPVAPIAVITTPEIAATGIVRHLADVFGSQSGKRTEVRVVAPGEIVGEATRGAAEVVVTNDPNAVAALRSAGLQRLGSAFARDDYVIVGPRHDPAHVRSADGAAAAFRRIISRRRAFCSPVSVAPLHDRELAILNAANVNAGKDRHWASCAGDAATVLADAARRGAYTLTDRATADAVRPNGMAVLLRGGSMLANDFTIILLQRPKTRRDAEWFVEWVMSFRGRDTIDTYRFDGQKRLYMEP